MTYPTMPRPTDNTGDDHRAAIAALEEAIKRNQVRGAEVAATREGALRIVNQSSLELERLERDRASLRRGIAALKGEDQ